MSEGRKTRRAGPKDEKAKLDRDWQKISQVGPSLSYSLNNCTFHKINQILFNMPLRISTSKMFFEML